MLCADPSCPLYTVFATLTPSGSSFSFSLLLVLTCGVLALLSAWIFSILIGMRSAGTKKMEAIGKLVRQGAMAFQRREYSVIFLFLIVIGALIYGFIDTGWEGVLVQDWAKPFTTVSFLVGALCSILA